jgi:hypothetical protein
MFTESGPIQPIVEKRPVGKVRLYLPFFAWTTMFYRWLPLTALRALLILIMPTGLLAQSIPSRDEAASPTKWQPPVRFENVPAPVSSNKSGERFLRVQYLEPQQAGTTPELRSVSEAIGPDVPLIAGPPPIDVLRAQSAPGTMSSPPPFHQVIRAPRMENSGSGHELFSGGRHSTAVPTSSGAVHPPVHLLRHHTAQAPPAVIPDASQREVWKTPYSYGYFGASGSRQWTRHFGYRDRDKEWRLR